MKTNQTSSFSLHPPVIAGASTGGERTGFFDSMNTPIINSLDWYREKGSQDPDIAALVSLIDRLQSDLVRSLQTIVSLVEKGLEDK